MGPFWSTYSRPPRAQSRKLRKPEKEKRTAEIFFSIRVINLERVVAHIFKVRLFISIIRSLPSIGCRGQQRSYLHASLLICDSIPAPESATDSVYSAVYCHVETHQRQTIPIGTRTMSVAGVNSACVNLIARELHGASHVSLKRVEKQRVAVDAAATETGRQIGGLTQRIIWSDEEPQSFNLFKGNGANRM